MIVNNGKSYNTMFVHYNDEGNVAYISNEQDSSFRIFEISDNLIIDFLEKRRNASSYNIDYFFNLANGIVEEETNFVQNDLFYTVPELKNEQDITIVYDFHNLKWVIKASDTIKRKLEISPILSFNICKKNNYSYLYKTLIVNTSDLLKKSVEFEFTLSVEKDLKNLDIVVKRRFEKYGLIIV
jgi:hypothetical protein